MSARAAERQALLVAAANEETPPDSPLHIHSRNALTIQTEDDIKHEHKGGDESQQLIEDRGTASTFSAFWLILKSYVGSGLLGMPFAFLQGGIYMGVLTLVFVAILSAVGIHLLLRVKNALSRQHGPNAAGSFGRIAKLVFGTVGEVVIQVILTFTQIGFACAYVIFISTTLHELIPTLSYLEWAAVEYVFYVMISLPREFKFFGPVSIIGYTTELFAAGYVVYYGYANEHVASKIDAEHLWALNVHTLPVFFGIAVYTFEGIGLVIDMEKSMKHPEHFEKLLWLAYCILVAMFVTVGVTGFLAFGDETESVIILNFPSAAAITKVLSILLMISLYCSFPVQCMPVFALLENYLFTVETHYLEPKRTAMRAVTVAITVGVAVSIPHFGLFMSLIGGLGSSSLCFLFPTACYLKFIWVDRQQVRWFWFQLIGCCAIFLIGSAAAAVSTWATITQLVKLYS